MTTEREDNAAEASETPQAPESLQPDPTADPKQLRNMLEEEREKAQSFYQSWQRSAADFQNYKRRIEEERSETARFANAALIINLLPLADDLDRALHNVDTHIAGLTWVDGIRIINRKFQMLLEMAGVQEIDADGKTFDPSQHEAISSAPGEEGKVIAVVQKGYKLGDRVIRPAMVVVGNGQGDEAGIDGEEQGT
ncbi:MAG: nucleotide exchange factor GrpE [Chloroflexota bacterium]|nr:nucleotide exchange factor GrpE [Chloroflexota bacterium]